MIKNLRKATSKIKQKMRLGELKRAVKNTRDVDSYLHHLENTFQANHLRILAEIDELRTSNKKRNERIFQDIDAALKYRVDAIEQKLTRKPTYISNSKYLLFSTQSMELVIPSEDAGLVSFIEHHGVESIEPGTRAVIQRLLAPGMVAVDIGANIGIHSVTMGGAVGHDGKVYAFEPTPAVSSALRYTCLLNGLRHLEIVSMAVLDKPQRTKLYSFNHSPENSVFQTFDVNPHDVFPFDIEACSLDSYFPPGSQIDLVKADVEGAEPLVFAGMQRVIEENPQIKIIMEISPMHFKRSGIELSLFLKQLADGGFILKAIDEETGALSPCQQSDIEMATSMNVLLERLQAQ
jgi:FkbM family methyltransferase